YIKLERKLLEHQGKGSPIGCILSHLTSYILDSELRPVLRGMVGELYIGGKGLARGYLNQKELTAERFIHNPFLKEESDIQKQDRLYRTGDLVYCLADGNMEYIGRIDHQVKVRGFRIELGEIEIVLNRHPKISQAVVMSKLEGGQ